MAKYYPINLALKNKRCVVIGAGVVAERKVRRLLECGGRVLVISRSPARGLKTMAGKWKVIFKRGNFRLRDLSGAFLVIAATADRAANSAVSAYCRKKNILVNVVDSPEECSFILPSIIRRGDLTISISTSGASPALAKKIRQHLGKAFGAEYGALLSMMKKIRPVVLKKVKSARSRKKVFNKILKDISNEFGGYRH